MNCSITECNWHRKRNVSREQKCELIASTVKPIQIYCLNRRSVYCCMQNISQTASFV